MKRLFILSVITIITFSSCRFITGERISGNGNIQSQNRTAGNFTNIDVSGAIEIYVKQDSASSVRIETDENLLGYIEVFVRGNDLVIKPKKGINPHPSQAVKVYVSNPAFNGFEASGACKIISENKLNSASTVSISLSGASEINIDITCPKVDADASGAGKITLRGQTKDFRVEGSGSTDIRCYELATENTKVSLSGAGDAQVFASVSLNVDISGAADVRYKGNPSVSQSISGAGSIKKVE
jgi:hypothetical protein